MSQTLHCCKQLRLLLIKDVNSLRAKLAAEPHSRMAWSCKISPLVQTLHWKSDGTLYIT
jgi:hypothetical protein